MQNEQLSKYIKNQIGLPITINRSLCVANLSQTVLEATRYTETHDLKLQKRFSLGQRYVRLCYYNVISITAHS